LEQKDLLVSVDDSGAEIGAEGYILTRMFPLFVGRPHKHSDSSTLDLKGTSMNPLKAIPAIQATPRASHDAYPQRKPLRPNNDAYSLRQDNQRYGAITKPKVITVVRAGRKPYANMKILLNRRSVQSYERLLNDISESFGPKWKNNKVRSLYTLTGREILSISDFFRGDSIFVAVGNEKISFTDVQEIIETLYPDSPYAKSLLKNIEKQKKKAKQQMLQSLASDNLDLNNENKNAKRTIVKPAGKPEDTEEAPTKRPRPRAHPRIRDTDLVDKENEKG